MSVMMIGVDPHKGSRTAVAAGRGRGACRPGAGPGLGCSGGAAAGPGRGLAGAYPGCGRRGRPGAPAGRQPDGRRGARTAAGNGLARLAPVLVFERRGRGSARRGRRSAWPVLGGSTLLLSWWPSRAVPCLVAWSAGTVVPVGPPGRTGRPARRRQGPEGCALSVMGEVTGSFRTVVHVTSELARMSLRHQCDRLGLPWPRAALPGRRCLLTRLPGDGPSRDAARSQRTAQGCRRSEEQTPGTAPEITFRGAWHGS